MSAARRPATVVLATLVVLFALLVASGLLVAWLWSSAHPCWRYSNAAWCGHFCDDDPCACPARALGAPAYGGGPGCVP